MVKRGVGRIAQQVDQHLLQLIGIALHRELRAGLHLHREPRFETDRAPHRGGHFERLQLRARQLRQARVGADEAAQALRPAGDHGEAAAHIVAPIVGERLARHDARQAAGDGLDGRQRIVELVARARAPAAARPAIPVR